MDRNTFFDSDDSFSTAIFSGAKKVINMLNPERPDDVSAKHTLDLKLPPASDFVRCGPLYALDQLNLSVKSVWEWSNEKQESFPFFQPCWFSAPPF